MNILVTGGAGFIGSNFIRHMFKTYHNYRIYNFDVLTYAGNLDNLEDISKNPNYHFIQGDIRNLDEVTEAVKGKDAVIHFAAESHVDRSILGADDFITTNVYGTYCLLEAAKKHNIKKFLHVSTDEVYGSIEKDSFTEQSPLNPSSPYSASKASSDMLALSYYITHKLPVLVTRSSNNYGPYQYPEKFIPLFITNCLEGEPLPLYGDGLNVRDWLHVIDNCKAIDTVFHKGSIGEIYNIGSDNEKNNLETAELIVELLGKDKNSIRLVKDRLGHDRRYSIDSTKTKKLGWEPEYDFHNGLTETIKWYQQNISWWEKIKTKKEEYKAFYKNYYVKESRV
ncbi:MAG: dTDP-glucose 4,6-dehydratase [Armatimonadota bacterium]